MTDVDVAKPVPESTLRDRAYRAFTNGLLSRTLHAGQFISQRELVEITGLPLGAIRELIPRLEAEGLIRTVPQRGMQIAQVDISLIKDAFQFRLFIEREAVALFTRNVTDEQIQAIRVRHEAILRRAAVSRDPALLDEAQEIDWGFHDDLVDALDNKIISNAYRVNSIKIRLIRQSQTRLAGNLVVPVIRDHLEIIDRIENRDPEKAVSALSDHIEAARRRALGL